MDDLGQIGFVGFGEVGAIFANGLVAQAGVTQVSCWDVLFAPGASGQAPAVQAPIRQADGVMDLCQRSRLIFSAVTAANTLDVAREVAQHIQPGCFFLDLNSASPGTKREAAALIDARGGRYVEAGVMTSVPPYGIRVPMLLGGEHAQDLLGTLLGWGMDAKLVSTQLGVASAIKMSRSVMIKGLEALVIESYATARFYGVEEHVLPTLQETFPHIDWAQQGRYFFSRVVQHGKRRAEEMRESARTVADSGMEPTMASAIARKQDWVAQLARQGVFDDLPAQAHWQDYADRLLAHVQQPS